VNDKGKLLDFWLT